jgi:hypothetical protein
MQIISIATQSAAKGTQILPLPLPLEIEIGGRRFPVRHQSRAFLALNEWILEAVADGRICRIELLDNRCYRIVCKPESIRELGQKIDDLAPLARPRATTPPPAADTQRPHAPRRPILKLR